MRRRDSGNEQSVIKEAQLCCMMKGKEEKKMAKCNLWSLF